MFTPPTDFAGYVALSTANGTSPAESHVRAGMCLAFDLDLPAAALVEGLSHCLRDALTYLSPADARAAFERHLLEVRAWLDEIAPLDEGAVAPEAAGSPQG